MLKPLIASAHHNIQQAQEAANHVAEHTAQHVHHAHEMDYIAYIFHSNIINIIFVAWFVIWLIKKANVKGIIEDKKTDIQKILLASDEEKNMAEEELQDAKKHVKNLDKEVRSVLLEAKNSAEAMYEKIKTDTKKRADEINSSLERMVEAEKKSASEELSNNLAEAAFDIAETHIKKSLNADMHNKHINEFIDSLDEKKVN